MTEPKNMLELLGDILHVLRAMKGEIAGLRRDVAQIQTAIRERRQ